MTDHVVGYLHGRTVDNRSLPMTRFDFFFAHTKVNSWIRRFDVMAFRRRKGFGILGKKGKFKICSFWTKSKGKDVFGRR